jgi:hypothetical protein
LFIPFLLSCSVFGQVTIKEKMTILPKLLNTTTPGGGEETQPAGGVASGFIMPKSGILQIRYTYANRVYGRLPDTVMLMVHRFPYSPPPPPSTLTTSAADTVVTDRFKPRFTTADSANQNYCDGSSGLFFHYAGARQPFNAVAVNQGDTVQFFYVLDNRIIGGLDTLFFDPSLASPIMVDANVVGWTNVYFKGKYGCVTIDELNVNVVFAEPPTIMLGETKYYQAELNVMNNSKLVITESYTPPSAGGATGATFTTIVRDTVTSASFPHGKRLGAYYEYKNPSGGSLPLNQVRLVGKYWNVDSTYRVRLIASKAGKTSDTISIEVKSPKKLGTSFQKAFVINSAETINVDSLIVLYAGKYGIPPQYLKGQIYTEASKDSGANNSGRFYPSYRYEPWRDLGFRGQWKKANRTAYMAHPFWVESTGMDPTNVPTTHQNVRPVYYPTTQTLLGDYLSTNLLQYLRGSGGKRYFIGISDTSKKYLYTKMLRLLIRYYLHEKGLVPQAAKDSSENWMRSYFSDAYNDVWAQTRKAASYGFSQMLYTTAIRRGYPKSVTGYTYLPEYLSHQDTLLPLVNKFHILNVRLILGLVSFDASQWNGGFESVWLETFQSYNPDDETYGQRAINSSSQFLPLEQ